MRSRGRFVALWLCAVLQLLTSVQPALGLSLCLADDGHSTFERAHAQVGCLEEIRRHHPEADAVDDGELARHACRDVSITERRLHRASTSHGLGLPAVAVLVARWGMAPHVARSDRDAHRGGPPVQDSLSALLRSVVLLV